MRKHLCNFCGKGFNHKANLKVHVRIHTGEKPFKSSICDKEFTTKSNLNIHIKMHLAGKKVKCNKKSISKESHCKKQDSNCHKPSKSSKCKGPSKNQAYKSCKPSESKKSKCKKLSKNQYCKQKRTLCRYCYKLFPSPSDLERHLKTHLRICVCKECGKKFKGRTLLKKHMVNYHGIKKTYVCHSGVNVQSGTIATECEKMPLGKRYSTCRTRKDISSNLALQKAVMEEKSEYACLTIERKFKSETAFLIHKRSKREEVLFSCEKCEMIFTQLQSFKRHKIVAHKEVTQYPCHERRTKLTQKHNVVRHGKKNNRRTNESMPLESKEMSKVTSEKEGIAEQQSPRGRRDVQIIQGAAENAKNFNRKSYTCENCGHRSSTYYFHKVHMMSHKGIKCFKCNFCKKKFPYFAVLNRHYKTTHGHTQSLVCKHCKQVFRTKPILQKHVKICGRKKYNNANIDRARGSISDFLCAVCGKRFTRKGNLTVHVRIHTGERLYKSSVCDKAFHRKGNLDIHMRRHLKGKKVRCKKKSISEDSHCKEKDSKCHKEVTEHTFEECGNKLTQMHSMTRRGGNNRRKSDVGVSYEDFKRKSKEKSKVTGEKVEGIAEQQSPRDRRPVQVIEDATENAENFNRKSHSCEKYRSSTNYLHKMHMMNHKGYKCLNCDLCTETFPSVSLLNQHYKTTHEHKQLLVCKLCKQVFRTKPSLTKHKKSCWRKKCNNANKDGVRGSISDFISRVIDSPEASMIDDDTLEDSINDNELFGDHMIDDELSEDIMKDIEILEDSMMNSKTLDMSTVDSNASEDSIFYIDALENSVSDCDVSEGSMINSAIPEDNMTRNKPSEDCIRSHQSSVHAIDKHYHLTQEDFNIRSKPGKCLDVSLQGEDSFICRYCEEKFVSEVQFKKHMITCVDRMKVPQCLSDFKQLNGNSKIDMCLESNEEAISCRRLEEISSAYQKCPNPTSEECLEKLQSLQLNIDNFEENPGLPSRGNQPIAEVGIDCDAPITEKDLQVLPTNTLEVELKSESSSTYNDIDIKCIDIQWQQHIVSRGRKSPSLFSLHNSEVSRRQFLPQTHHSTGSCDMLLMKKSHQADDCRSRSCSTDLLVSSSRKDIVSPVNPNSATLYNEPYRMIALASAIEFKVVDDWMKCDYVE